MVERHNEIIRIALNRTESQIKFEDLICTLEQVVAIVTFMHNALVSINQSIPYQGLIGRQPATLPPLEGGYFQESDPSMNGNDGRTRRPEVTGLDAVGMGDVARIREIVAANIIQVAALKRLERANNHKMVAALERKEFEIRDLVDIWYDSKKDTVGWRGPAQIALIQESDGQVTVRFQGRTLDRRHQEVRRHVRYFVFLFRTLGSPNALFGPWGIVRNFCEGMKAGFVTLGLIYQRGWCLSPAAHGHQHKIVANVAFAVAAHTLHLYHGVQARISCGCVVLPALPPPLACMESEVLMWERGIDIDEVVRLTCDPVDMSRPLRCKELAQEMYLVDRGKLLWSEVRFVKYVGTDQRNLDQIAKVYLQGLNHAAGQGTFRDSLGVSAPPDNTRFQDRSPPNRQLLVLILRMKTTLQ